MEMQNQFIIVYKTVMKNFCLIALCAFVCFSFFPNSARAQGSVEITGDKRIPVLLDKYAELNKLTETIPGFRVQIHFGGERDKAREIKAKFLMSNPGVPAYDSYQSPNFRVRVGDFRTKLEAQKYLRSISSSFPSAFVVADDIQLPPLLNEEKK
jgi:hypothetical protein